MTGHQERWGCWYCPQDFASMTDAWGHMDTEHPAEAAADLDQMNADLERAGGTR